MADERLKIYINDHLALAVAEAELVERCLSKNREGSLGAFLEQLHADVGAEKRVLQGALACVGGVESQLKQGVAWLAEKAGRFKLNDRLLQYSDLSRLFELEAIMLAARAREAFWEAMAARESDLRLSEIDFDRWRQQADQHARVLAEHFIDASRRAL